MPRWLAMNSPHHWFRRAGQPQNCAVYEGIKMPEKGRQLLRGGSSKGPINWSLGGVLFRYTSV